MRKFFLLFSVVSISLSLSASLIQQDALFIPAKLGTLQVMHDDNGFRINKDGTSYDVDSFSVDPLLRKMKKEQMKKFLMSGRIMVNQATDGGYTLKSAVNLKGGGPVSGAIAYWVTKSLCWGGVGIAASAAATGIVAATIATAGAGTGAIVAGGCAYGVGVTAAGTASAAAGAAALTAAGVSAATATTAVAATATGAGSAAAVIASIETASVGVSFAFTVCPFLP